MEINEALKSEILKEYLNDDYLEKENLENIKKVLFKNSPKSIMLEDFFKKEKYYMLKEEIRRLKFKRKYFPDKLSFNQGEIGKNFKKLIQSEELKTVFEFLLGKKINDFKTNSIMLKHKDYSLLSDNGPEVSGFLINFFFNDLWKEEYGGYFSFVSENAEVLRLMPKENCVSIVYVDKTVDWFIKYINVNSNKRQIYFSKTIIL